MLKILALSYIELLLITTHCSWIVKKIKNNNNNNLYSHQISLLFPRWLWSNDGCLSWVVVWWSNGHGAVPGSRCGIPGSWVVVIKCFITYQTKDPILTNNYPLIQAYNLLRFFRVWLNFLKFNFIMELKIYSFWISELE